MEINNSHIGSTAHYFLDDNFYPTVINSSHKTHKSSGLIIGYCDNGYSKYLLVLKDNKVASATSFLFDQLSIDEIDNVTDYKSSWDTKIKSYFGHSVLWLRAIHVQEIESSCLANHDKCEGSFCFRCKEYALMAVPNQDDGTFICYSCRFNRFR
jgi:hypothetical protein